MNNDDPFAADGAPQEPKLEGVGLRRRFYWLSWLQQEMRELATEHIKSAGLPQGAEPEADTPQIVEGER